MGNWVKGKWDFFLLFLRTTRELYLKIKSLTKEKIDLNEFTIYLKISSCLFTCLWLSLEFKVSMILPPNACLALPLKKAESSLLTMQTRGFHIFTARFQASMSFLLHLHVFRPSCVRQAPCWVLPERRSGVGGAAMALPPDSCRLCCYVIFLCIVYLLIPWFCVCFSSPPFIDLSSAKERPSFQVNNLCKAPGNVFAQNKDLILIISFMVHSILYTVDFQ